MPAPSQSLHALGYGALLGMGGFAWEQSLALVWDITPLSGLHLLSFGALYASVGAILLWGVSRLTRQTKSLCWGVWGVWCGLLLVAKIVVWKWSLLAALGLGGALALTGVLVSLWLESLLSKRFPSGVWPFRFVSFLCVSTLFFLNLNVYGAAFSPEALWVDGCVLAVGAFGVWILARGPMGRWETLQPNVVVQAVFGAVLFFGVPWVWFGDRGPETLGGDTGAPLVLIVVDTLRADHMEVYGYSEKTTPFLKTFAEDALVFEACQSTSPWTLPAFGTMLTGELPSVHGAGVNPGVANLESALRPDVETLPETLLGAGYLTGAVVSNVYLKRGFGVHRGFQRYDDAMAMGHYPLLYQPMNVILGPKWAGVPYRQSKTLAARAQSFLGHTAGYRTFLMLHFMDPHAPYFPSDSDLNAMTGSYDDPDERGYDAEIRGVDRAIQSVVEALPKDAIVVITSDHGERFGEHSDAYEDWHPPLSRHGMSQYQELLHVPLMIRAPAVEAGRVERRVSTVDLAANLAHLVGVQWGGGGDVWPELRGERSRLGDAAVSEALLYGRERKAVVLGDWKAIWGPERDELYYLKVDPTESKNVAQQYPEVLEGLKVFLPAVGVDEWVRSNPSSAEREGLRSIGYVEGE